MVICALTGTVTNRPGRLRTFISALLMRRLLTEAAGSSLEPDFIERMRGG